MVNEPTELRAVQVEPAAADGTRVIAMNGVSSAPEAGDATAALADPSSAARPLVILATDDGAVCIDDLCLPLEDRP